MGLGLGCAELGAGLAGWAGWLGCGLPGAGAGTTLKRKLAHLKMERLRSNRKNQLPDGQQQQAISIYLFLESLGFRVSDMVVLRVPL